MDYLTCSRDDCGKPALHGNHLCREHICQWARERPQMRCDFEADLNTTYCRLHKCPNVRYSILGNQPCQGFKPTGVNIV